MSTGGAFLRAILALIVGVFVFLALGYFFIANGVRDVVYHTAPVLSALEAHDAYERLYDDGIISQQFEGTFKRLVGGFAVDIETEASLLKQIVPPDEIRVATEDSVTSIVAFLNDELHEFDASINLTPAIQRIKPTVFALLDERIDGAKLVTVSNEADLRRTLQRLFGDIASGDVPDSIPDLAGLPKDLVLRAYLQSVDSLAGSALSPVALANLDRDEQAIADAFGRGDSRAALKLVTRAIADDAIDSAILELRNDLDSRNHFDAVDKIAETIGSSQETLKRFRLIRTSLGLLTGFGSIVALVIFVLGILGMAGVLYPFPRHMITWPGVTIVVCGLSYFVLGWSVSVVLDPWESTWCSFVEVSSCNLGIDVGSQLLSYTADTMTTPSIVATIGGIAAVAGARFAPKRWNRVEHESEGHRQLSGK